MLSKKDTVNGWVEEFKAACITTCPMHTDARGYIRLIREDDGFGAIKLIRDKLFIPGTLGRICAHPCEFACKYNEVKNPLAIASLKRYAADNFDREEDWDLTKKESNSKKVCVIGSGPSGLQASLELIREGFDVTVFEKHKVRGGLMALCIPEYRLPRDILEKEISYLDKLGVKFELGVEVGVDISFVELLKNFDSVIVAVGKYNGRVDRGIDNIHANGIFSAVEFLREVALTKTKKDFGKSVLVVGGGDVSMDCARVSRRLGASVNIVCLESSYDSMMSSKHEIKGALDEGVKFNHARAIKEIIVDSNNRVQKVILKKCLSMFDDQGKFSPKFDDNDTYELDIDTIIFAIGQEVDGGFAQGILEQLPNSNFKCDKFTLQSYSNEKVFICGDASGESVIVIQAMATGKRAAESVIRYLRGENLRFGRSIEDTSSYSTGIKKDVDWSNYVKRLDMRELPVDTRIKSFDEVALGYTKEEAIEEALRCKQCGLRFVE